MPRTGRDVRRARATAAEVFGHTDLLPGQEEAMRALMDGHDVLLVSPTGSGKSLTYQVPGVLLDGCTIVVSPLLALQRDQIEGLAEGDDERTRGVRISSAETEHQRAEAMAKVAAGETEFLFLSPEQLANHEVRREVAALQPSLVAVDEAHCVSAWGHVFRPDYFRMGDFIDDLGRPRVIALTATAAPPVREDIVDRLGLKKARTIVTGFDRPNLSLSVRRTATADDQRADVVEAVTETSGPGIVYCRTRRAAEEYAADLEDAGVEALVYHAGLRKKVREEAQRRFMDGDVGVVVATSAFGMGIDKADIGFVFHAQVPESPDTYYQEIGRAGRDGEPASAVLFYRPEDLSLGRFFTGAVPKRKDVEAVVGSVAAEDNTSRDDVRRDTGLGPRKLGRILNLVDEVTETSTEPFPDRAALVDAVLAQAKSHRQLERSRVEMMRGYAETDRCRWQFLLGYFGEESDRRCGHCDSCENGTSEAGTTDADEPFPLQSPVDHPEFGRGTVMDIEEDRITILFEEVGYRTLDAGIVEAEGLLTRGE
ncbi:MAG TPA: RecQ family ATP-dependent DNA helicase [Nocardioidaceae bacterium]|nr:RecQ family ATP-dependent DNA helicase [Nocardioidaceae bacterium]